YASSRTWSAGTGMSGTTEERVDVQSNGTSSSSGISMGVFTEPRTADGATGTRTATAAGNSDRGATQSVALKPIPMICTGGDDFNRANGSPGASWIVSSSGGSFGNPVIYNNRLRLTDATGNVATM